MKRAVGLIVVSVVAAALAGCGGDDGGDGAAEVLAQIELEGIPADVEAADDAVWVADTGSGGGLVKLDPSSLEEIGLLPVPEGAEAVGIGDSTVWALSRTFGDVFAFDREATEGDGETIDIGEGAPDPVYGEAFEDLAASGDTAYANGSLGLVGVTADGEVLEPTDAEPTDEFDTSSELEFSETPVVTASDTVWAMTADGVRDFDLETLEPLDDLGSSAEALAVGDDEVWAVADDGVITRLVSGDDDEEIANLEERFAGEDPEAIAYAGGDLWVVGAGQLLRIDPESGEEIGDTLSLPDGTDELGYSISAGAPDDSVVIIQRPTGMVWRVG